jgi:hypothetical protein
MKIELENDCRELKTSLTSNNSQRITFSLIFFYEVQLTTELRIKLSRLFYIT